MNMNNLRIFMIVAQKMNVTEASRELYISQPAVSKALKNLETSLNIKLFIRDKHNGLMLTDAGKEILVLARQMKVIENNIYEIASRENKLLRGKVKVGSFPAASTNLLPKTIALFRAKYPHVRIELMEGTSNQIKEWVGDRTVDIGIIASPFDAFEYKVLTHDYMVAIIPEHHPLQQAAKIDIDDYQNEFIFCKGGHETALSNKLQEQNISLKEQLTVQTADTLISMVKNNLGIGIISNFTLASVSHNFVVKDTHPRIERDIGIIAHSFEEVTPAVKEFTLVMSQSSSSL
ncbi:LysR family transcriptional regulator [Paenibacillus sp. sptzw28]|nr:LysR family transcriptional regulator [Paenibacillus sp. sptzw28]